jgi:acyl transferase domain-containing protein
MHDERSNDSLRGIAVIGMSGRFPRARDLDEYWHNLQEGVECISSFSDEELRVSGVDPSLISHPSYVKRKAILEDVELFDAYFFGFNPGEAEVIDPQQRLFLESAYEVLDNAGYTSEGYAGLIGVYAGCSLNSYLISNLLSNKEVIQRLGAYQIMIGSDKDFLSTRVSYKLNLKGPSIDVQTACSTSLVAVHLACQSLLNYECDMAIASGVSIGVPQKTGYLYQEGMILSPDGHCRAFDAKAQGTISGEGVGTVLLKRLTDALSDGDCIRAVIKGSAINNDGSLKAGYTAPSIDGQAEVIMAAQTAAGVKAEAIGYVEAHGTGTSLGDPIEIAALTKAFRYSTEKSRFCAIGSVKTNIGHLDVAAGVASLIKTVLALQHKKLPPSLHFENPNPLIDFDSSPFFVNTSLSEWKADENPRRAGVSSFGIGGTNAHLVVEEAPVREPSGPSRQWKLLTLSAKSDNSLDTMTKNLVEQVKREKDINLADVAYTLQMGRQKFGHRRIAVCQTREDAISSLDTLDSKHVRTSVNESDERPIAFMFSGQGTQYVNMAFGLYQKESKFRETIDFCSDFLKPHLGCDLRHLLFPDENSIEAATHRLTQTAITQPALFVVEYALAKLWEEWGIRPQAMIGHSIGEYVAACLSGVFSLEEALALVAARGRLIQTLPGGAMMAVAMTEKEVRPFLNGKLSLAAVNSSSLCVVSGETAAVRTLESELVGRGVGCVHLHTSHAFHSQMMEPIISEFSRQVKQINLKPPQIKFVSNVTGKWITQAEATDPDYWAKHIRQAVRFADGIGELLKDPAAVLLEVGPGRSLVTLVEQDTKKSGDRVVLSSVRHPKEKVQDDEFLLNILGRLWLEGAQVDWKGFYSNERRYRVALPAYPFERQRYWIEPKTSILASEKEGNQYHQKNSDISDWFYIPSWKRTGLPQRKLREEKACWLVFHDDYGLGRQLVDRLLSDGQDVISVTAGERYAKSEQKTYAINPQSESDYEYLLKDLGGLNKLVKKIVYLWSFNLTENPPKNENSMQGQEQLNFYSLLFLARCLGDLQLSDSVEIDVISNNMQEVTGNEELNPELSTILGPCKTIPQENPKIVCRSIDFSLNSREEMQKQRVVGNLLYELGEKSSEKVIAYRGPHRWVQVFEPIRLNGISNNVSSLLKKKGVYLITGGLGGIGLVFAEYFANTLGAKLILIGRSALPNKESWAEWLNNHDEQDRVSKKIKQIQLLERLGSEVLVVGADVCDLGQMKEARDLAYKRFGQINGIIHAAGIAGGSIIQRMTMQIARDVLVPKVKGAQVLHTLFANTNIDFVFYCSSINSILGGIGQAAYCSANAFLDAFAMAAKNYNDGARVLSISWDTWQEVGMEVDTDVPNALKKMREADLQSGLLSAEGIDVFRRVLDSNLSHVVVSTRNLQKRLQATHRSSGLLPVIEKHGGSSETKHTRPNISSEFFASRTEIELKIAEVWQELLGIEEVGVFDNFFELGGHSLIGTQFMSRLFQLWNIQLPLRKLFEAPTIQGLAELVKEAIQEPHNTLPIGSKEDEGREIIEI